MRIILAILLLFFFFKDLAAQDTTRQISKGDTSGTQILHAKIIDGDTIPVVDVGAAVIFPDMTFRNARELYKYDRLVYNVRKVYPYAKLAAEKLTEYKNVLDTIPSERQRKAYTKKAQKELEERFGDELKGLTYSQGKVLIKLIYRQTGNSSYDIVKELRGGFEAFILQNIARLFGYDLKTQYDPEGDDKAIERIVQMIEAGAI